MGRKRKQRQRNRAMVLLLSLLLIFLSIGSAFIWFLKNTVEPNLEAVGKMRARAMVTRMVTKAVNDQFRQELDTGDLIIRKTNEQGQLEMIQADTKAMNLLITEISKELQEEYRNMEADTFQLPTGTVLGSKIFSQAGPEMELRTIPLSVSGMDFKTEFEAQGINQTKYKVYIILKSQVKVMAPFVSDTFDMSSTILIAEAVVLGGVPDSYVQVPEEDILDVT